MIDVITGKPLQVDETAGGPALFDVPASQLKEIEGLLDAYGIRYWVDGNSISLFGEPETTVVYFGHAGDLKKIQTLLDSVS